MKQQFRLYRRRKGGTFYLQDRLSGKQASLGTKDRAEARTLLHARNESVRQPMLNFQIARAYLAGSDPEVATRTWQAPMDQLVKLKRGDTKERYIAAIRDKAFDLIRDRSILETRPEHFCRVLENGTVATNVFLRRIHNFALDMSWLPWPVLARKQWPRPSYKEKRAITWDEHQEVLAVEQNAEWRAFYSLLWHVGGAQTDVATLQAEDIDWKDRIISYHPPENRNDLLSLFQRRSPQPVVHAPVIRPFVPQTRFDAREAPGQTIQ